MKRAKKFARVSGDFDPWDMKCCVCGKPAPYVFSWPSGWNQRRYCKEHRDAGEDYLESMK